MSMNERLLLSKVCCCSMSMIYFLVVCINCYCGWQRPFREVALPNDCQLNPVPPVYNYSTILPFHYRLTWHLGFVRRWFSTSGYVSITVPEAFMR